MLVTASDIREVTYFACTTFSITLFPQHPKALSFPELIIWQTIFYISTGYQTTTKLQLYPLLAEYMDKQAISTSKVNKTLF